MVFLVSKGIVLAFILLFWYGALGEEVKKEEKGNLLHRNGFNFQGSYTYSRKVVERSEGDNSDASIFSYKLSYKKWEPWTISGVMNFFNDKDIVVDENRQLYLSGVQVGLTHRPIKWGLVDVVPSFQFRLPIGEYDWKSESLYLGVRGGANVLLPSQWLPSKTVGSVGITASKNFHKFNTRLGGGPNTEWSLGLRGSLSYSINQFVSVAVSGSYGLLVTYTPEFREFFNFSQSISSKYKSLRASLGHSFEGSVYAPDGIHYNVRFFDRYRSKFFVRLGVFL